MKLAIPSESPDGLASMRSGHFGHAPYFTVATIEDGAVTAVESVKNVDHDEQGCGGVIDYVISLDVDGILTVGMGRPPLTRFTQAGITVYSEHETPLVQGALDRFVAGEVDEMSIDDACSHH